MVYPRPRLVEVVALVGAGELRERKHAVLTDAASRRLALAWPVQVRPRSGVDLEAGPPATVLAGAKSDYACTRFLAVCALRLTGAAQRRRASCREPVPWMRGCRKPLPRGRVPHHFMPISMFRPSRTGFGYVAQRSGFRLDGPRREVGADLRQQAVVAVQQCHKTPPSATPHYALESSSTMPYDPIGERGSRRSPRDAGIGGDGGSIPAYRAALSYARSCRARYMRCSLTSRSSAGSRHWRGDSCALSL
jgi:hypothetical protein